MGKRLNFIDNTRGFAIFLVVLGHCIPGEGNFKLWIFSFHMPLFFIISGYLLGIKEEKGLDIKELVQNRMKTLILPYFIFSLCIATFYLLLSLLSKELLISEIQGYFIRIITFQGMESLWFLPCLFLAEIILSYMILKFKKSYIIILVTISFISAIVGVDINNKIIRVILRACVAVMFALYGYLIYKYKYRIKDSSIFIILMIITSIIFSKYNGFVGLGSFELNNIFLYFLFGIIGSTGVLFLIKKFDNKEIKILKLYGINSIVILCTHNILLEIIRLLDYKISGNILLNMDMLGSIILSIIIMILEIPIIIMCNRYLYFLFGKSKINNINKKAI